MATDFQIRDNGRTTVLLTGFGPFPTVPVNATMLLVPRLAMAAEALFAGVRVISEILPTEWDTTPARIDRLAVRWQPDLVIHFGVSRRARGFEIERRGRNWRALAADASGTVPKSPVLRDAGADLHPSRLPVAEIVHRLRRRHIAAFQSWNAGTYLCNAALYHALSSPPLDRTDTGFVHVPAELIAAGRAAWTDSGTRTSPGCPLSWGEAEAGGLEILATCLDRPSPSDAAIRRALRRPTFAS
jgi:pyroglutamyl-peptidase